MKLPTKNIHKSPSLYFSWNAFSFDDDFTMYSDVAAAVVAANADACSRLATYFCFGSLKHIAVAIFRNLAFAVGCVSVVLASIFLASVMGITALACVLKGLPLPNWQFSTLPQ